MPKYKNNHTVPCCLLRQWETYANDRHGVYQYDIGNKKVNFASSRGSGRGRFSFASKDYFYIPIVDNERRLSVENWLGDMESQLSFVIKKLNEGSIDILVRDRADANKLLMGLFSLRHRAESAVDNIRKYIEENPEVRQKMNFSKDRDINLVVLENMIHATTEDAIAHMNCKITVHRNNAGQFIIGDQPFVGDILKDGQQFIALSPNFFISIQKHHSNGYFSYNDISSELGDAFNKVIANHARKWIIANDKSVLKKYIPTADEPKQDDTPDLEIPKFIISGVRIA